MLSGCNRLIKRGQSPDEESPESIFNYRETPSDGPQYISETCRVWGLKYARAEGIGLATDLDGTGSAANPGAYREHLLAEMRTREIENSRELVESKNSEVVICRGYVPPGIRKGDFYDVEILLAPGMDGTSLEDGFVTKTRLRPLAKFGKRTLKEGLVVGLVQGPILVDSIYETREGDDNQLRGWILGGGVVLEDRPLGLTVRKHNFGIKTSTMISRALNARFKTLTSQGREGIAKPTRSSDRVNILLPDVYENNVKRFSQVISNVMYGETAQQRVDRLDELAEAMTNPATCQQAALRLEAIGKEGIPALKRSLNNPDVEIRFRAAEALAYCEQSDGLEILKDVAATEPAFRWHALTALSVSEDSDAAKLLQDLMQMESAETRYGAFRALHIRSPEHPAVYGERFDDFFMHSVPSTSKPMIHFSRSRRPEIVLFGDTKIGSNFIYVEKGLTIRSEGDGRIKLIQFSTQRGKEVEICSDDAVDFISTLAAHNFSYGKVLKIFREASKDESLEARLVVDAVPNDNRQYDGENSEQYLADGHPEPPNSGSGSSNGTDKITRVNTELVTGDTEPEESGISSGFGKLKGLFSGKKSY